VIGVSGHEPGEKHGGDSQPADTNSDDTKVKAKEADVALCSMDDPRKRTWPCAHTCSANARVVKVFPVPQAIISLPRSCSLNPEITAEIALS